VVPGGEGDCAKTGEAKIDKAMKASAMRYPVLRFILNTSVMVW
jgi:hypothetical protein